MKPRSADALLISREGRLRLILRAFLERGGYRVQESEGTGEMTVLSPQVVLLHSEHPVEDAMAVLRRLREWCRVPVLVLVSQDSTAARVASLEAGADDCVSWPCEAVEILARLRAIRRRVEPVSHEQTLKRGALKLDLTARVVSVQGKEVHLTPIEYNLLRLLALQAGKVMTQRQLLREIWDTDSETQSRHLRVHLSNMRRKLGKAGFDTRALRNEPGVGYRLMS